MDQNDVRYMVEEGPLKYIRMRANTLDFPNAGAKFYKKVRKAVYAFAKFIIIYLIMHKIYTLVTLEEFVIMMLAGVAVSKSIKDKEKEGEL